MVKKLTAGELGAIFGKNGQWILNRERGQAGFSDGQLQQLARHFDVARRWFDPVISLADLTGGSFRGSPTPVLIGDVHPTEATKETQPESATSLRIEQFAQMVPGVHVRQGAECRIAKEMLSMLDPAQIRAVFEGLRSLGFRADETVTPSGELSQKKRDGSTGGSG